MKHIYIIFSLILLTYGYSGLTFAKALTWSDSSFSLYARKDGLQDVLSGLASSQSIPVEIDESVEGTVNGSFIDTTRKLIFDQLIETYDLVWYFDGHILYIDKLQNTESKTISLRSIHPAEFKRQLIQLGVYREDGRFHWREVGNKKLVHISGPAPFVRKVSSMATKLDISFKSSDTVYKWKDAKGLTHYSTNAGDAPNKARTIDLPRDNSVTTR